MQPFSQAPGQGGHSPRDVSESPESEVSLTFIKFIARASPEVLAQERKDLGVEMDKAEQGLSIDSGIAGIHYADRLKRANMCREKIAMIDSVIKIRIEAAKAKAAETASPARPDSVSAEEIALPEEEFDALFGGTTSA